MNLKTVKQKLEEIKANCKSIKENGLIKDSKELLKRIKPAPGIELNWVKFIEKYNRGKLQLVISFLRNAINKLRKIMLGDV